MIEENDWLTRGIPEEILKYERYSIYIGSSLYLTRLNMDLNISEFAKLIDFPKRKVKCWENGSYNFTLRELSKIFSKLDAKLKIEITV